MGRISTAIVMWAAVAQACWAQSTPACCNLNIGDRVRLTVDLPYGAPNLWSGSCGTVICCDLNWQGPDQLFVSWDNWTEGTNDDGACSQSPPGYVPGSGWWVDCTQMTADSTTCPASPVCGNGICEFGETSGSCPGDCPAAYCPFTVGNRVKLLVDNPYNAPHLPTGWCGTVICTGSGGALPNQLLVSWDNWTEGQNDNGACSQPPPNYVPNSAWWVDCDQLTQDNVCELPPVCGNGVCEIGEDAVGCPADCDLCPNDPNKTDPGVCGCGVPDVDSDGDGTFDCLDACPDDPAKTAQGKCGCGVPDTDTDGDGTPDCHDACPSDPAKTQAGQCGCGVADTDTDGDGTPDCLDACPNDPQKTSPGQCGCGSADTDSDSDGTADCLDGCPNDPDKVSPGICDCGKSDVDSDGDGVADCIDNCPNTANPDQTDSLGDGVGDACRPAAPDQQPGTQDPSSQETPSNGSPSPLTRGCGFGVLPFASVSLVGLWLLQPGRRRGRRCPQA